MKNVTNKNLKTSIAIPSEEYDEILKKIISDDTECHYEAEGLWYSHENKDYSIEIDINKIKSALSSYFDVQIMSIHMNDSDKSESDIWLTYIDK